ncbi:membrane protein [Planctomycetales bacterium]|nr:membrane protein [Planctomycetales bacterium]GHS99492.1 membrane protein [Planctomycetales bacterium]GHT08024.1 membrane protein [Planctomycetales bacterium]
MPAFAGQTVDINGPVTGPVSGNGSGPNNTVRPPIPTLDAEGNTVNVNSGASVTGIGVLGGYVYGVVAYTTGADTVTATGNSVNISNANVGPVSGGGAQSISGAATASGNRVNINNGATLSAQARGGDAESTSGAATANGNSVNVSGATVGSNVYGGKAKSASGAATANGNSVSISNGSTAYLVIGGLAESTSGAATASGNSVNISNGATISYYVRGGNAESLSGTATASGNSVNIGNGATIADEVHGGYATSFSNTATASGNSVNINGATLASAVYGGYADSNGAGKSGDAVNNRVVISNGEIGGNIFGGFSMVEGGIVSYGDTGSATGNSVTLIGASILHGSLFGGFVGNFNPVLTPQSGDAFSGNTLHVAPSQVSGIRVGGSEGVQNFELYNFTFQKDAPLNAVGLNADTVYLNDGASRASVIQSVNIQGGGSLLPIGHRFQIIAAGALDDANFNQTTTSGRQGVTLLYDYDLAFTNGGKTLTATVSGGPALNEPAKALSEGWLGGLALVAQGADLIAGRGVAEAVRAARGARENVSSGLGLATFGAFSGGYSRYNTGSHVDMSSLSVLAGLSYGADLTPGHLTLGGFFEYGNGSYDTYNSFSTAASVHGVGDLYHLGGGVLGHFDFVDTGPGHLYTEASFRAGGVHNEYSSGDLRDSLGRKAGYDSTSAYYGLHVGTGYVLKVTDKASLDLSGKYFWTRQSGDSVTLTTGDPVKFDDADSHRLRLGGRFSHAANKYVAPYIGGAWEPEFDGKVKATTHGLAIDAPSLRGDTGIGELLTLKPAGTWSLIR